MHPIAFVRHGGLPTSHPASDTGVFPTASDVPMIGCRIGRHVPPSKCLSRLIVVLGATALVRRDPPWMLAKHSICKHRLVQSLLCHAAPSCAVPFYAAPCLPGMSRHVPFCTVLRFAIWCLPLTCCRCVCHALLAPALLQCALLAHALLKRALLALAVPLCYMMCFSLLLKH